MATMDGAKTFTVEAEHELRLEVEHKKTLTLTLLKGTAELFGAELPRDQPLPFVGTKLAIFTWHGATLEVRPSHHVPCPPTRLTCSTFQPLDPLMAIEGLATARDTDQRSPVRTRVTKQYTHRASLLCPPLRLRQTREPWVGDFSVGMGGALVTELSALTRRHGNAAIGFITCHVDPYSSIVGCCTQPHTSRGWGGGGLHNR